MFLVSMCFSGFSALMKTGHKITTQEKQNIYMGYIILPVKSFSMNYSTAHKITIKM